MLLAHFIWQTVLKPLSGTNAKNGAITPSLTPTMDFGLWRSYSAVTVSPSGPRKLFKGVTTEQARCYSAGKHGEKICIGYQLLKLTGTNLVLTAGKLLLHQQAYSMTANFCTTVKP